MSGSSFVTCLLAFLAACLIVFSQARAGETRTCPPGLSAPVLTIAPLQEAAVAGKPYTLEWSLDPAARSKPSTPTYLVVAAPASVRFEGSGFFALAPGAPGPFGMEFGSDRARAIVPLHTAFSDKAGAVTLLFQVARETALEWSVVQVDVCRGTASGDIRGLRVDVLPGSPVLIGYDEFASRRPDGIVTPKRGSFLARVFGNSIEVIDRDTKDIVLQTTGMRPVFSPTGRFLVVETGENRVVDVFDLVAGRRVAGFGEIEGLYWSHEDSFVYADGEMYGTMLVWGTLIDAGPVLRASPSKLGYDAETADAVSRDMLSPGRSNPDAVYMPGRMAWSAHVSVEAGVAVFLDGAASDGERGRVADLGRSRPMLAFDDARGLQAGLASDFALPQVLFRGWDSGRGVARTNDFEPVSDVEDEVGEAGTSGGARAERRDAVGDAPWSADVRYENPFVDYLKYFRFDDAPTQSIAVGGHGVEMVADDVGGVVRSAVPIARIPAASHFVGGEATGLLSLRTIDNLRSGEDDEALEAISNTLAPLYEGSGLQFAFGTGPHVYETLPFPDPRKPLAPDSLDTMDLAEEGRDTWNWKSGSGEYWLTQTVGSGRVAHAYQFSLIRRRDGQVDRADPLQGLDRGGDRDSDVYLPRQGDIRGDLGSAFGEPSFVGVAVERYLLIATRPIVRLIALDLSTLHPVCSIASPADSEDVASLGLSAAQDHLFQFNRDGKVNVYHCGSGARILSGLIADNELVVMDEAGFFDGSEDAAAYVELKIPGLPGRHVLSQFASKLRRPGLLGDVLAGRRGQERAPALAPPSIAISIPTGRASDGIEIEASSTRALRSMEMFANGRVSLHRRLHGSADRIRLDGADLPRADYATVVVSDADGLTSAPISMVLDEGNHEPGRLFGLLLGVDEYPRIPAADLRFAAADARRLAAAARGTDLYAEVELTVLTDREASAEAVLERLDRMVSTAGENDTLLFSFAGHGLLRENRRLALALSRTALDDLDRSALDFDAVIARLSKARGRVVVLLDACHSGAFGSSEANDAGIRQLVTAGGAGIVVLAASKGRQLSEESSAIGGGRFSVALERSLTDARRETDRDGNGAISVLELYAAIKAQVSSSTENRQIPWISRNRIYGDFDLF